MEEFDEKGDLFDTVFSSEDYERLSCFAHTLQLVVSKFDACKEAINRAKKLVAKINNSVKATEMLKILSGIKLLGDCPTRWSSTFLLLERLLRARCHLETVLDKLKWDNLNARQWKTVESVTELLKLFADYTTLSSGEHYSTISSIIPIIMELSLHLDRMNTRHGLSTVANILNKEMERRFTMFQNPHDKSFKLLYIVATFLNPRYRIVL